MRSSPALARGGGNPLNYYGEPPSSSAPFWPQSVDRAAGTLGAVTPRPFASADAGAQTGKNG